MAAELRTQRKVGYRTWLEPAGASPLHSRKKANVVFFMVLISAYAHRFAVPVRPSGAQPQGGQRPQDAHDPEHPQQVHPSNAAWDA